MRIDPEARKMPPFDKMTDAEIIEAHRAHVSMRDLEQRLQAMAAEKLRAEDPRRREEPRE